MKLLRVVLNFTVTGEMVVFGSCLLLLNLMTAYMQPMAKGLLP